MFLQAYVSEQQDVRRPPYLGLQHLYTLPEERVLCLRRGYLGYQDWFVILPHGFYSLFLSLSCMAPMRHPCVNHVSLVAVPSMRPVHGFHVLYLILSPFFSASPLSLLCCLMYLPLLYCSSFVLQCILLCTDHVVHRETCPRATHR